MVELQYFGHSFFQLKHGPSVLLIDPVFDNSKTDLKKIQKIPTSTSKLKKVSVILLTNETPEHFDPIAVQEIALRDNSTVIGHDVVLQKLNLPRTQKVPIYSNSEITVKGIKIKSKTAHFPKSFYPLGYLLDFDGKKIYHAGVTSLHDSFEKIQADVSLLPISSRTMDVVDAVRAAKILKSRMIVPMQYDIFESKKFDPVDLKKRIEDSVLKTDTIILNPGQKFKI